MLRLDNIENMNIEEQKVNNTNEFAIEYAFSNISECLLCEKNVLIGNLKIAIISNNSLHKKKVIEICFDSHSKKI
jgi:hypothetical protein